MIGDKIKAAPGKVFRRISDGVVMGNEVVLGYFFSPVETPILEMPEHFEQIDERVNITPDMIAIEPEGLIIPLEEEVGLEIIPEYKDPKNPYTWSDIKEMEQKLNELYKIIEVNKL